MSFPKKPFKDMSEKTHRRNQVSNGRGVGSLFKFEEVPALKGIPFAIIAADEADIVKIVKHIAPNHQPIDSKKIRPVRVIIID